jgi:hypothetical protein
VSRWARKRDDNERDIVAALRCFGASVQPLDAKGAPDLLVGYEGVTLLMEVKQRHGQAKVDGKKTASGLLETQEAWWSTWRGLRPVVVTTAEEAIAAIQAAKRSES